MEREKDPVVRDADEVIRGYYEQDIKGAFRDDGTEPVSSVRTTGRETGRSAELSGGDMDAASEQSDDGTETVGGSNPTPDQDIVDEIGRAAGIQYQDNEPLKFDKMALRDEHRWELDPASSEDYQIRIVATEHAPPSEPSPAPPPQQESKKSLPRRSRSSRQSRAPKKR